MQLPGSLHEWCNGKPAAGFSDSRFCRDRLPVPFVCHKCDHADGRGEKHFVLHPGAMTQNLPQYDFARFWYVGKTSFLNRAAAFGLQSPPSPWLAQNFPVDITRRDAGGAMWLYPPTMTLLAIPFSFIPLASSFWVWRLVCILVAVILLRNAGLAWFAVVAGLLGPAGMRDLNIGQNGTLTAGLLVAALLQMDRKPGFAGVCAGLLCIKPQIGVALPLILLHPRRRKALFIGLGVILTVVLLSLIVTGIEPWLIFLKVAQPIAAEIIAVPFKEVMSPGGCTVFMMARSFSMSIAQAGMLQGLTALSSLCLIIFEWRRENAEPVARMALTVSLSLLMMPYGYDYDLVAFSVAMSALFIRSSDRTKILIGGIWLFSGYTSIVVNYSGYIFVPLAAALGAYLSWRAVLRGRTVESHSVMPGSTGEEEAA